MKDLTERRAVYLDDAIEAINKYFARIGKLKRGGLTILERAIKSDTLDAIKALPPAQPERDIPKKPIATTDRAWGIPHRQAVCPECDYYLGHVSFLGDYKGKRITYCETCGQAIDWEGWDFDE